MDEEPTETCMFFVDDSNIWIEAQKFAASGNSQMPKLADSDRDPRLRIDVGRLLTTLRKGRKQGRSFMYGSRPPPNDSVWAAFKKCGFELDVFDRSCGKEKQVDTAMATEMAHQATKLDTMAEVDIRFKSQKMNTTFIAISGDLDMRPAIKLVLELKIKTELWAWKSGMSKEYLRLDPDEGLLSVNYLDWIFDKIFFTNFRSTRRSEVDPSRAIVLCDFAETDEDDLESSIGAQLIQLRYLFYTTQSKTKAEVIVEFPNVKNMDAMVFKAQSLFGDTMKVLSYPEYASRVSEALPPMVETSNMYAPLTDEFGQYSTHVAAEEAPHKPAERQATPPITAEPLPGRSGNDEMEGLHDLDNTGDWETVAPRSDPRKRHGRALRQPQRCSYRVRCKKKGDCGYSHTPAEQSLFQDNPHQNFQFWKTKKCNLAYCSRGKQCAYYHTENEAWCLHCRREGHNTDDCRYASRTLVYR